MDNTHFLIVCKNSRDADTLFREFGMIMSLTKNISHAQDAFRVIKLKDGTCYRFVTKNRLEEVSTDFKGKMISCETFRQTMTTYVNQKRSNVNA